MKSKQCKNTALPLAVGTLTVCGILACFQVLELSANVGDVCGYLEWSRDLLGYSTKTYASHLPGYPVLISIARTATFGFMSDLVTAQCVAYAAWVLSVFLVGRILEEVAPNWSRLGSLLFAIWPIVGVSYVAIPVADIPARAVCLAAFLVALKRRWGLLVALVGCGLMIHQSLFPYYFLLCLVCVVFYGMSWVYMVLSGIPFLGYYSFIALATGNWNWLLEGQARMHFGENTHYLVFDGVIRSLGEGNPVGIFKGALVIGLFLLTLILGLLIVRKRDWLILPFLFPVLLFSVVSGQNVIFLVIRLSPLLVIPACAVLSTTPVVPRLFQKTAVLVLLAIPLIASQFAFSLYMTMRYADRSQPPTAAFRHLSIPQPDPVSANLPIAVDSSTFDRPEKVQRNLPRPSSTPRSFGHPTGTLPLGGSITRGG